jgi:hypothetical protein
LRAAGELSRHCFAIRLEAEQGSLGEAILQASPQRDILQRGKLIFSRPHDIPDDIARSLELLETYRHISNGISRDITCNATMLVTVPDYP